MRAVVFDRDGVLAEFDLDRTRAELGPLLPFGLEQLGAQLRQWATKPAPEAYRAIAGALGVAPEACLFVDDRPECVEGARRVGMRAWLLDRRKRSGGEGLLHGLDELFSVAAE